MVASVPELANRQRGRPKRRASSRATATAFGVGWAKWVPAADLGGYGLLYGGVRVAREGGAVAAVQVHVLVAVDVVDLRAMAVAQPDRLRCGDLPARGDPAGQVLLSRLGEVSGVRLAADEDLFLGRDDLGELGIGDGVADALGAVPGGLGALLDGLFGAVLVGDHDFKAPSLD